MTARLDPFGPWELYSAKLPDGAVRLGVLYRPGHPPGVLVRFEEKRGKPFAVFNDGVGRIIDGRTLPGPRRTCKLEQGRPMTVYLDAQTVEIALRLGKGVASVGIRKALLAAA